MFVYWILFPLLFAAILLGLGLGLRRLTAPFTSALLLPAGYAVAVVVCSALTWSPATPSLAGPVVAVLAVAGWVVGWRDLRGVAALRENAPWVVAALLGFLVFGLSAIVAGKPTFTGASQIVDIAHQFDFADYLGHHGRELPDPNVSAALNVVDRTLSTGYPSGPQAVLGTIPKTFGFALHWSWQPMLAMLAALIVASAYAVLRQVIESRLIAAVGAFAAGQASALISYGQIGGIKELAVVVGVLTTTAFMPLFASDEEGRAAWRKVLPFSVAAAAVFSIFSLTLMPWLGILGIGALILTWRAVSVKAAAVRGGIALGAAVVLALPMIVAAFKALDYASQMGSDGEVGNLAHPLSRWAGTGIWFARDHRYELTGAWHTISVVVAVIVILLALLGLWTAWRRQAYPIVAVAIASFIGAGILVVQMGPWVELKGLVIASPVVLLLAATGLTAFLGHKTLRYAAFVGLAGLVVAGLIGDVKRYGAAQLASYDRYTELQHYGEQFAGKRGALHPDWDEQAEFQLRKAKGVSPFNFGFVPSADWAKKSPPQYQYEWDLDQIDVRFMSIFETIFTRRSPGLSRPPQNYQQVSQGRFYDVWQRTQLPGPTEHIPLAGTMETTSQQKCQAYVDARPKGATVTIATSARPSIAAFDDVSKSIDLMGGATLMPNGAGTAKGTVDVGPTPGLYDVFVSSTAARKAELDIAGRHYDIPRDRTYVIRPFFIDRISLAAGSHPVELKVGGTSLRPGSGSFFNMGASVGPVQLVPAGSLHPPLIKGPASSVKCPADADWVETP